MLRDEGGRWVRLPRTSARPLLGTKSSDFSQQQSRQSIQIEGFVGSNGHRLATDLFAFDFLKTLLVSRIRNLGYRSGIGFENSGLAELGREIQCGNGCPQINRRTSQGKTFKKPTFRNSPGFPRACLYSTKQSSLPHRRNNLYLYAKHRVGQTGAED